MAGLEGWGLREVVWDACDGALSGALVASPADAQGRGIALSVVRDGAPADLTGATLWLLWRHREARRRGKSMFEEVDASAGTFKVYWPAAMACHEGAVDAQVAAELPDGTTISSLTFQVRVEQRLSFGGSKGCCALVVEFIEGCESLLEELRGAAEDAKDAADELREAAERGDFDGEDGAPGPAGPQGEPGADADIVGASATVDGTTGAPTVAVELGGEPGARTLAFAFSGLKGEPGEDGASGGSLLQYDSELAVGNGIKLCVETAGEFHEGDFVIDPEGLLGLVSEVTERNDGYDNVEFKTLEDVRRSGIGLCTGLALAQGEESASAVTVQGRLLREGDVVLSTDTGCLAKVASVDDWGIEECDVHLAGLATFATRAYVDSAIEAILDLSEVEF